MTTPFDWGGHHFPAGRRVLLDLYGTDRHPGTWSQPDVSDPERFGTGGRPRSTWCRRAAATIAPDTAAPASGSRSR